MTNTKALLLAALAATSLTACSTEPNPDQEMDPPDHDVWSANLAHETVDRAIDQADGIQAARTAAGFGHFASFLLGNPMTPVSSTASEADCECAAASCTFDGCVLLPGSLDAASGSLEWDDEHLVADMHVVGGSGYSSTDFRVTLDLTYVDGAITGFASVMGESYNNADPAVFDVRIDYDAVALSPEGEPASGTLTLGVAGTHQNGEETDYSRTYSY